MNYLSGALRYVAGGESDTKDAVPRLVDRIKTSALPQDRRAAISLLTEAAKVSPQRQVFVGELAIKVVYAVLEQDKDYDDTLKATLDLLIAICGTLDPPARDQLPALLGDAAKGISEQDCLKLFEDKSARAAATNVDVFLGLPNAVALLLDLLEKTDFYVKFGTIELLTAMAANSRQTLQMAILEAPQGVSRICDLLDNNHRHVRYNAVLLLSTLCDGSPEICKIVAYGGVLEKLFALIETVSGESRVTVAGIMDDDDDEDSLEAAIVVQDVLLVLRNLIKGTNTTRTFFRDTGCLPRLVGVVKRSTAEANMLAVEPGSGGMKAASEKQARRNLIVSMQCISGLVQEGDNESRLVKNVLATTSLFKLLTNLAFNVQLAPMPGSGKLPESALPVRVAALKTIALLARGHDKFRDMFSSTSVSDGVNGESGNVQVAAVRAMTKDTSAAIRVAAFSALRESFVVDAGLDLPSSNLLNAMSGSVGPSAYAVGDRNAGMHHKTVPSRDLSNPANAVQFIADSLKASLVGWPNDADVAGVFYSAAIVAWVVDKVQGARERLLASYVNGGSLLPQIFRILGKLERENGPPEVRIALFSLGCTWLHGSPSAVSAFLSSAMHLPMLIDVLNGNGSRGDLAEVHVRGLAAVLLGICLQVSEGQADPSNGGGFLSGASGASIVIPKGTVADIIRNRVGVTEFTGCLEDLRASKAFSIGGSNGGLWALADRLVSLEDRGGFLSGKGGLGHDQWYGGYIISTVNEVYKDMGTRALDLLSDQPTIMGGIANGVPNNLALNGHAPVSQAQHDTDALLADSTRDEVLNSYKEFIRSQDESLNAARRQIEELSTALREAQVELDAKIDEASAARESESGRSISAANEKLRSEKAALESLLEEKTADFVALSDAFAALEDEQSNQNESAIVTRNSGSTAELHQLRSQNAAIRSSLVSEEAQNANLMKRTQDLETALIAKETELEAVGRERDVLSSNTQPDVAEALRWRTRAEVAEANIAAKQSLLDATQDSQSTLQSRLRESERSREEGSYAVTALEKQYGAAMSELEKLRSTRQRELQVSRESSNAANTAAQKEIAMLRSQLEEARRAPVQSENFAQLPEEERERFESLKQDHNTLVVSFEQLKTELLDTKSALTQWQRKGEAIEASKERDGLENKRLSGMVQSYEAQVHSLKDSLASQSQSATASSNRVLELERQSTELEEIRRRSEDESRALKEELAARTEQSIRLSGQLYEAEESKMKFDEELQRLRNSLTETTNELKMEKDKNSEYLRDENGGTQVPEEISTELIRLQQELEAVKDALADSKDRESLMQAQAQDREAVMAKCSSLEETLRGAQAREADNRSEVKELKQRLLKLDEAEDTNRSLASQVETLQKSLADFSKRSATDRTSVSTGSGKELAQLRTQVTEKDMRLKQLETSLTIALDQSSAMKREVADMEKQLAESATMLSVLSSERDSMASKYANLEKQADESLPAADHSISLLEEALRQSEEKRNAVSAELASLVEACRVSESEALNIREENNTLHRSVTDAENKLKELVGQIEHQSLSEVVAQVVSSTMLEAALIAVSDCNTNAIELLRAELGMAESLEAEAARESEALKSEVQGLQVALQDRDELDARTRMQAERITQLTAEVKCAQHAVEERDDLTRDLEAANATVAALREDQRKTAHSRSEVEPAPGSTADGIVVPDTEGKLTQTKRVKELEAALRDAARTVSGTNLELISAQALLVELSADKTAIRNELNASREENHALKGQLSITPRASQNEAAMSEVSEPEQLVMDLDSDPARRSLQEDLADRSIALANAQVENLRTVLDRTISEAESAYSFLENVKGKVGVVEEKLQLSRAALQESQEAGRLLKADLENLREASESEKQSILQDVDGLKSEIESIRRSSEKTVTDLASNLAAAQDALETEKDRLQNLRREHERDSAVLKEECSELQARLQESSERLKSFSDKSKVLETSNSKYASTIMALEGTVTSVNKRLEESKSRGNSLEETLRLSRQELNEAKEEFENDKRTLLDKHNTEAAEYESEIDRAANALEDAERKLRNVEHSLKNKVATLEATLNGTQSDLSLCQKELKIATAESARISVEKAKQGADFSDLLRKKTDEIGDVTAERDSAHGLILETKSELDSTKQSLLQTKEELTRLNSDLEGERERRSMLEAENQDCLQAIEALEVSSKRLRDDVARLEKQLEQRSTDLAKSDKTVEQQSHDLAELRGQVETYEVNVKQLRSTRAKLEDEGDRLRDLLDSAVAGQEAAEQDNSDLKAWVADLERQATELQSAATNFEDVEQSLRETLESQRDAMEQNAELSEELKKAKEVLTSVEGQLRNATRDKFAAESGRESAQKRATDLEGRIREIRGEHLSNVSRSEAAIGAQAQRCAELETALAASERRVAELASASDSLFGVRAELNQRQEDVKNVLERAQSAERRAEELQTQVHAAEKELSGMRESGSNEAYRALQAEHDELLVCLADLELECTMLKEELGRE